MASKDINLENMGFVRKFRFTVDSKISSELAVENNNKIHIGHYVSNFNFDINTIKIKIYDVFHENKSVMWDYVGKLKNHHDETIIFSTYDGCGGMLYSIEFSDISFVNHRMNFAYDDKEFSQHEIEFTYKTMKNTIQS